MINNYILLQSYKSEFKKNDEDVYKILKKIFIKDKKNNINDFNIIENEIKNVSIRIGKIVDLITENMSDDDFENKIKQELEKDRIKKQIKKKQKRK